MNPGSKFSILSKVLAWNKSYSSLGLLFSHFCQIQLWPLALAITQSCCKCLSFQAKPTFSRPIIGPALPLNLSLRKINWVSVGNSSACSIPTISKVMFFRTFSSSPCRNIIQDPFSKVTSLLLSGSIPKLSRKSFMVESLRSVYSFLTNKPLAFG